MKYLLHEYGAWELEKLNRYSTPIGKKMFLVTVLLWFMGLIISISTRPSTKKKLFPPPLLVLYYDFENINWQLTHRELVSIFF